MKPFDAGRPTVSWLRLSLRTTIIAVSIAAVITASGTIAALGTHELGWLILAAVADLILVVVLFAKSTHNIVSELAPRVIAVEHAVALDRIHAGTPLDLLRRDLQRDVSALLALHGLAAPRRYVPPPGGWAATPDTLLALVSEIADGDGSQLVVECGSGTSTAWMGLALAHSGGRLVSLEHSLEFAAATNQAIERLALSELAEVRQFELTERLIGGQPYEWFPEAAYADLAQIDLLFVDGPPGYLGHDARFPAVPLLASRLRDGALVVLDDIDRPAELAVLEQWVARDWGGVSLEVESRTDRAVLLRARRVEAAPSGP